MAVETRRVARIGGPDRPGRFFRTSVSGPGQNFAGEGRLGRGVEHPRARRAAGRSINMRDEAD